METEFWFTDIFKGSGIQEMLEKIDTNISFKNVDTDVIDPRERFGVDRRFHSFNQTRRASLATIILSRGA